MKHEKILITGGCGFIGSSIALTLKNRYPQKQIMVMDNLKRRGSELNISRFHHANIEFIHGDIRNRSDFPGVEIDAIIECSAEPSVLAGYGGNPLYLLDTNLGGTINCLEEARKFSADIIFLSTSRVYPYEKINIIPTIEEKTRLRWGEKENIPGWSKKGITENFSLLGNRSLYGASKLSSELILQEYLDMYGLKGVINRCGVIAGPWQFGKIDQGVFTLWMLYHYFKREGLSYIGFSGSGKQVRDLLHVEDLCNLIDLELSEIEWVNGCLFNVGGGADFSLSLLETTALCQEITGNSINIVSDLSPRPADIAIYITDYSKVFSKMKWAPICGPAQILEDIYHWIKKNETVLKNCF